MNGPQALNHHGCEQVGRTDEQNKEEFIHNKTVITSYHLKLFGGLVHATNLKKEGFKTLQEKGNAYSAMEGSSVSDVAEVIGIGVDLSDSGTISRAPQYWENARTWLLG